MEQGFMESLEKYEKNNSNLVCEYNLQKISMSETTDYVCYKYF
jgi:hypothetical protein